jgi:hypothetical protein
VEEEKEEDEEVEEEKEEETKAVAVTAQVELERGLVSDPAETRYLAPRAVVLENRPQQHVHVPALGCVRARVILQPRASVRLRPVQHLQVPMDSGRGERPRVPQCSGAS